MVINGASADGSDIITIISSCDRCIRDITINNGTKGAERCTILVINDTLNIGMDGSSKIDNNSYGVINGHTIDVIRSITVEFNGLLLEIADIIGATQINMINLTD